jgi:transposase
MKWKLTTQERNNLIASHKKERDRRICDRIKAVLLYDDGYSYTEIAKILLLDDETIRRHIQDYKSIQKIKPENGGSESYLTAAEAFELKIHLELKTFLHVKDICTYIKEVYKKKYSVSGMTKWLKENGFCYKKSHGVPAKADTEKQAAFIEKYNELKDTLKPDEVILFGDNVHPQHQTRLAYGWIKKGVRKSEKMTACQKRVNIIGAIEINTHQVTYKKVDWVDKENLKQFAQQLCNAYPNTSTIHWILDNAPYHKNPEFLAFIATTKIKIHYLPPYSPNLNPIERLWKIMHENTTYNRYHEKFSQFTESIVGFFENMTQYKSVIQNRITDNFQRLKIA